MAELWPEGPIVLPHTITHDGVELTIPDLPTTKLLYWLATGQWWQLYPGAVDQAEFKVLYERLFDPDDELDLGHISIVSKRLFGRLAGMAYHSGDGWWPSVRLAADALSRWPLFASWCAVRTIKPLDATLWEAVMMMYGWVRDGLLPQELAKLEQELWSVPQGAVGKAAGPESSGDAEAKYLPEDQLPDHVRDEEASAFLSMFSEQVPGGGAAPMVVT